MDQFFGFHGVVNMTTDFIPAHRIDAFLYDGIGLLTINISESSVHGWQFSISASSFPKFGLNIPSMCSHQSLSAAVIYQQLIRSLYILSITSLMDIFLRIIKLRNIYLSDSVTLVYFLIRMTLGC